MASPKSSAPVRYKFDTVEEQENEAPGTGLRILFWVLVAFGLFLIGDALYALFFNTDTPLIDGGRSEMIWDAGQSFWRGVFFLSIGTFFWYLLSSRKEKGFIYGALGLSIFGLTAFYSTLHKISLEPEVLMKDWLEGLIASGVALLGVIAILFFTEQLNTARKWNPGKVYVEDGTLILEQIGIPWYKRLDWKRRLSFLPERTSSGNGKAELRVRPKTKSSNNPGQMKLYLEFENEEAGKELMEQLEGTEASEGTA